MGQYDDLAAQFGGAPAQPSFAAAAAQSGGSPLAFDPTEGMSTYDKVMAGMGKSVHDTGQGIGQLLGLVSKSDVDASKQTDAPLMNTGAGLTGNILGQVMQAIGLPVGGAVTMAGKLGTAAAVNGLQGFVQPVGTGDSRLMNTAVNAALGMAGQGVASGVGALLKPAVAGSDSIAAAAKVGPLSYGQLTGNPMVQRVESWLAKLPGSKGWYDKLSTDQQQTVQSVAEKLGPDWADTAVGQGALDGKNWVSDADFVNGMQALPANTDMLAGGLKPTAALKTAAAYAGGAGAAPAETMVGGRMLDISNNPTLQDIVAQASGNGPLLPVGKSMPMNGPQGDFNNYQAIRSILGKAAFGADAGSPDAEVYKSMRNLFDNTAVNSLADQGVDPAVLTDARHAFQVQSILKPAQIVNPDGSFSYNPAKVGPAIDKAFLNKTVGNLPDEVQQSLLDLSQFSKATKPVSSSGTAENQAARGIATGAILGDVAKDFGEKGVLGTAAQLAKLTALVGIPWTINKALQVGGMGFDTPQAVSVPLSRLATLLPAATKQSLFGPGQQ